MARIMLVDDNENFRRYLRRILRLSSHEIREACSGLDALKSIEEGYRPDLMFLDLMMPEMDGYKTLKHLNQMNLKPKVIVISALSKPQNVVKAIRLGAMDYLTKEAAPNEIKALVEKCLNWPQGNAEVNSTNDLDSDPTITAEEEQEGYVFRSPKMRKIREMARQIADVPVKILLLGESGTGKDMLARYIHEISNRSTRPFVKVNCAAMPADLIESELFGFEKGAFTSAAQSRQGKLELAKGGTLFLDEIGEFSMTTQAKLLQALEDNEFMRLGGASTIHIDARVIAATNRNLESAVEDGTFRKDLYFRLQVVSITLPPLKERKEDIEPLINLFLKEFRKEFSSQVPDLNREILQRMKTYSWPGNVRELKNMIRKYAIFGDASSLLKELNPESSSPRITEPAADIDRIADIDVQNNDLGLKELSRKASESIEKKMILQALAETNWNRKKAAELLKISYKAFRYKIKEMGIEKSSSGQ